MKHYSLYFTSDEVVCRSNDHFYGNYSTFKVAKAAISNIKRLYADKNPRNFRIYDQWADVADDEPIPCIYRQES